MIWHSSDIESVLGELSVDPNNGLPNGVAYERLRAYGKNQISEAKPIGFWRHFLSELNRKSVYALAAISIICIIVSIIYARTDFSPLLIIAILVLNALFTAINQVACDRAVFKQKASAIPTCTVIREGIKRSIPSNELVVGDIIVLNQGDYICADARLIETNNFRSNELALTGELIPVEKDASMVFEDMVPCAGRKNMVFSGCNVTHGSAKAVVVETGLNTEIGKTVSIEAQTGSTVTGIEKTLGNTSRIINIVVVITCTVIFLIGMLYSIFSTEKFASYTVNMLLCAVALGVCAIPEGLPYVSTIVNALGAGRLIRDGVLIKNNAAIENLAKTTVLCADKTGVFTKNRMVLNGVYDGETLETPTDGKLKSKCAAVLRLAVSCSMLENDTTEAAIEEACLRYNNMSKEDIGNAYPRLATIPFDGVRKMMTSINMIDGKPLAVIKGAPEVVIEKCVGIDGAALKKTCDELASKALRLICIAVKPLDEIPANPDPAVIENDLKFAGIICLADPPRSEAANDIAFCAKNGIKVIMVTGDNLATACAVARSIGILSDDSMAITGSELDEISDDELKRKIGSYTVFARISPAQKLRIVSILKANGEIVTVTGNGLDDADVLSVADVGLAIGIDGNDVARGNSDAIIKGNKFSSVANVFKECYGLFENIKMTVQYLISCNASELLIFLFGLMIFRTPPLLAVQLLLINLLTDAAPAVSLTIRPADKNSDFNNSKLIKGHIFDIKSVINISVEATFMAICGFSAFAIGNAFGTQVACTMAFLTVSLSQIIHAFNFSTNRSIIFFRLRRNGFMVLSSLIAVLICLLLCLTPLGAVFSLVPLTFAQFIISAALSIIIVPVCETIKLLNH